MKTQYDIDMEQMKKRKANANKRQASLDKTIDTEIGKENEAKEAKKKEDVIKKRQKFAKDKKNYKDFNAGKMMA